MKKQKVNIELYKIAKNYERKNIALSWLINLLNINLKAYNKWWANGSKEYMTKRDTSYDLFINKVFYDKDSKYWTHRKWGHKKIALKFGLCLKMVLSSMKAQNLVPENCEKSRKWKAYTKKSKDPINTAPNLLKNQETNKIEFIANKSLEKICLDISELKIKNKKIYLFAYIYILDYL
ncbi:hypothetical protein [Spiroplasma tabanidicola]|uniref:Transposase n=1 Tax=Spiroplasma tabanidicola TaxID=324079 RepID=A0A6I6C4H8_9MOLU|nr:hypothetical protein [Spiroplasma tabanidicola]QGS51697.1 transposase [Spiroplasma tabanidicola]